MKVLSQLGTVPVEQSAPLLLGQVLVREINGQRLAGKIVEVEAYHESDPSAHSHGGETVRNRAMFGPAGYAYIYRSYGIHWCFNVSAGPVGEGGGILIRALEPLEGLDIMQQNRGFQGPTLEIRKLCSGPGKLTQALQIDQSLYGHNLAEEPLYIEQQPPLPPSRITTTARIGISKSIDHPLRFYIKDSPFISRT